MVRSFVPTGVALAGVLGLTLLSGGVSASAADAVPYKDPNASGTITLCDPDLQPITEGTIHDLPFVWRAVGSEEAPPPYNNETRKAVLYAAQPRQGVDPAAWTSNILTAATMYKDVAHPMAQATKLDIPLWVNVDAYPPRWDGLIQLRLYYTTENASISTSYATTDIQVSGNTWHAVNVGSESCGDTKEAISPEIALPHFNQRVEKFAKEFGPKPGDPTSTPSSDSSTTPSPGKGGLSSEAAAPVGSSDSTGGSSGPSRAWTSFAVLGALVLAGGAAAWVWQRQAGHS